MSALFWVCDLMLALYVGPSKHIDFYGNFYAVFEAVFPAVQPPSTTSFQLYREKAHLVPEGADAHHVLQGSTEAIEYFSAIADEQSGEEIACQ